MGLLKAGVGAAGGVLADHILVKKYGMDRVR